MGIDFSSKLLVGRLAEDILAQVDLDEEVGHIEYLEGLDLEYASEYYDSDPLESVWGIEVGNGSIAEVISAIKQAEKDFFNITGLIPEVYQLPHVW